MNRVEKVWHSCCSLVFFIRAFYRGPTARDIAFCDSYLHRSFEGIYLKARLDVNAPRRSEEAFAYDAVSTESHIPHSSVLEEQKGSLL